MVRFITVFCLCITIAALGVGLPPGKTARAAGITVTADFGTRVDDPLIKSKFGVYNSGYVSLARWLRDMPLIQALRPAQVRIEQQWGDEHDGWPSVITGTASNLKYNFTRNRSDCSMGRSRGVGQGACDATGRSTILCT